MRFSGHMSKPNLLELGQMLVLGCCEFRFLLGVYYVLWREFISQIIFEEWYSISCSATIVLQASVCGDYICHYSILLECRKVYCVEILSCTLGANVMCHKQKFIEILFRLWFFFFFRLYLCLGLVRRKKEKNNTYNVVRLIKCNIFRSLILLLFNRR